MYGLELGEVRDLTELGTLQRLFRNDYLILTSLSYEGKHIQFLKMWKGAASCADFLLYGVPASAFSR
jgi:hypothetical protein